MANGKVISICIGPEAKKPMQHVDAVNAIAGEGLTGDRYAQGKGSYQKGEKGKRQVTLINSVFVENTSFRHSDTRRNILTEDVELMDLIGQKFQIGEATFRGVKYCDPCPVPSALTKNRENFKEIFHDRGGLVAEVLKGGIIRCGDTVIPPKKDY